MALVNSVMYTQTLVRSGNSAQTQPQLLTVTESQPFYMYTDGALDLNWLRTCDGYDNLRRSLEVENLSVELELRNTSESPMPAGFGLSQYRWGEKTARLWVCSLRLTERV